MRDIGAIVWVILVVIGVVSSIVSNARRLRQSQAQSPSAVSRPPPQPATLRQAPQRVVRPIAQSMPQPARQATPQTVAAAPPPAVERVAVTRRPPPPAVEPHPAGASFPQPTPAASRRDALGLRNRKSLVRAVIAAEVLGTPLALRDRI